MINHLKVHEALEFKWDYCMSSPLKDSAGKKIRIESMKYFGSPDKFSAYIRDEVDERMGLRDREATPRSSRFREIQEICQRKVKSLIHKPYNFYKEC